MENAIRQDWCLAAQVGLPDLPVLTAFAVRFVPPPPALYVQ